MRFWSTCFHTLRIDEGQTTSSGQSDMYADAIAIACTVYPIKALLRAL